MLIGLLVPALAITAQVAQPPGDTTAFRKALKAWEALSFDVQFGVNFGDATGTVFTFEGKKFTMDDKLEGASLSKWPSAVMISGIVADGFMQYTDRPSKYLDYWTTDRKDPRAAVTLQTLLSFTSGVLEDPLLLYACQKGFEECVKDVYDHLGVREKKKWTTPNTTFQYLSTHLQLAGGMAAAAAKKPIEELFEKYLFRRYNMTGTSYGPSTSNPSMAAGIVSTGNDFEKMLSSLLRYDGLPKKVQDAMETDWTHPPIRPSGDGWFGHYAMGHWWECLGYGTPDHMEHQPLPQQCVDNRIQAGPGEFGYYPILDRSGGVGGAGPIRPPYYFQIPIQEPDALSGIPEYLRIVTKPAADIIMAGGQPEAVPKDVMCKAGGCLISRDIDFIYGELGNCVCEKKSGKGEPYASLNATLPADEPDLNRRDILAKGIGLTLFDVARIQEETGPCRCTGRGHKLPEIDMPTF